MSAALLLRTRAASQHTMKSLDDPEQPVCNVTVLNNCGYVWDAKGDLVVTRVPGSRVAVAVFTLKVAYFYVTGAVVLRQKFRLVGAAIGSISGKLTSRSVAPAWYCACVCCANRLVAYIAACLAVQTGYRG